MKQSNIKYLLYSLRNMYLYIWSKLYSLKVSIKLEGKITNFDEYVGGATKVWRNFEKVVACRLYSITGSLLFSHFNLDYIARNIAKLIKISYWVKCLPRRRGSYFNLTFSLYNSRNDPTYGNSKLYATPSGAVMFGTMVGEKKYGILRNVS